MLSKLSKMFQALAFPTAMATLMFVTVARYNSIQDFRKRSSEHRITVEAADIESLERAIKGATFQDVDYERVSGDRYRIVVRCPPDNLNSLFGLIQRLGGKRYED